MARENNSFKAGLFVIIALTMALVVVYILSDFKGLFERKQTILVQYRLADGLQGLKIGASVTLGDQPIGAVRGITDVSDADNRVIGKRLTVSIPARYEIGQNAVVELKAPPLGSGAKLNIRSVGDGTPHDGVNPIVGALASSDLTQNLARDMGVQDEQRQQIREIIANIEAITTQVRTDLPELTTRLKTVLDKAAPIMDKADASLANLQAASDDLKTVLADVKERRGAWLNHVDSITAKTDETVAMVQTIVKDKEPAIRKTVDNIESITTTAREQTIVQIGEALDRAVAAMENFKAVSEETRAFIAAQRPVLERALANAQITTDQLKLAAIEVRRSPWRLLYAPGDDEIANDNLYDAARSFAQAAGALDAAVAGLRAVSNDEGGNPEEVTRMLEHLESLYAKYHEAETRFWQTLNTPPGKGSPKQ